MNMQKFGALFYVHIFSLFLYAYGISYLTSTQLISRLGLSFYSTDIPSLLPEIALQKTFDTLLLPLVGFVSLLLFIVFYRTNLFGGNSVSKMFYLLSSILFFAQTVFVNTAYSRAILWFLGLHVIYYFLFKKGKKKINYNFYSIVNGVLVGAFAYQFVKSFQFGALAPFLFVLIGSAVYTLIDQRHGSVTKNPIHLLLAFSFYALQPVDILLLVIFVGYWLFLRKHAHFTTDVSRNRLQIIYESTLLFVVLYNPLYYVGNFDTIEEGFWLGWVQRLSSGRHLYSDVYTYHPPLLPWFLSAFTSIIGDTTANIRLALHLLEVISLAGIYFVIRLLIKNKLLVLFLFSLIVMLSTNYVRNNVELRLFLGMASVALAYISAKENGKKRYALASGLFLGTSIFVSIETGFAALIASIVTLFASKAFKPLKYYLIGILLISVPVLGYLALTQSFWPFLTQTLFYARGFAAGYMNIPIKLIPQSSYFHPHLLFDTFSSEAGIWVFTLFISFASVVTHLVEVIRKDKNINLLSLGLTVYGLILIRSALGRSDWYHLLSVLLVMLIPFIYHLFTKVSFKATAVFLFILIFISFPRYSTGPESFLSKNIFSLQVSGQAIGDYVSYRTPKMDILVGSEIDTSMLDSLVDYVSQNVPEDGYIFAYPWMPELYFLTNRNNPTITDTPYTTYSESFQRQVVDELESVDGETIVYNPTFSFGGMYPDRLPILQEYLLNQYEIVAKFGPNLVMK